MRYFSLLSLLGLFILPAHSVLATSSDWHHIEGGSIRIVTNGVPDASGQLRGALEIRLKPGWKTYWRDPGASGVPPTVEIMAGTQFAPVEIGFPTPKHFDDGYAAWAGYDHSVALALAIDLPADAPAPHSIDASIFLGVCETICIPVGTTLTLDLASHANNFEHASVVEAAFSALPQPDRPDFSAKIISRDNDTILIEAQAPEGANILDLFISGTSTLTLDTPQKSGNGSQTQFHVPIAVQSGADSEDLAYTLVTDNGAVSGHMRLP